MLLYIFFLTFRLIYFYEFNKISGFVRIMYRVLYDC